MKLKHLVLCGVLTAVALTIFIVEAQLPPPVPLPGIKPGLANLVTLFALVFLSPREALGILTARILLGCMFTGQPFTLLYSLTGGLACLAAEELVLRILGRHLVWAVSILGAMIHNTVQVMTALVVTQTPGVLWYLPPLIMVGILTGAFIGLCIRFIDRRYGQDIENIIKQ